ncbi:MAG TPA: DUF3177 family protein [Leptolyngbyaceae cyanobacterium M65_K2018_010]|nr:DUF3177 family protein [Leptolyngbyaceae cyanobacterium M65_K2018_010]
MVEPSFLRALVWTDYRLAVLFTVVLPLGLLIWAFVQKNEPIQHLLTIYWKVASLLMITVYLMIGGFTLSFVAAVMARVLIPIALWFWVDLNEEIREQPDSLLKLVFSAWRWAVTLYNVLGAAILLTFLPCGFSNARFAAADCQTWLEPPLLYKEYFHSGYTQGFLGFFGLVGLAIYMASLAWFVFVRLGKQGRQAIN